MQCWTGSDRVLSESRTHITNFSTDNVYNCSKYIVVINSLYIYIIYIYIKYYIVHLVYSCVFSHV